jgi:hypothetical protein
VRLAKQAFYHLCHSTNLRGEFLMVKKSYIMLQEWNEIHTLLLENITVDIGLDKYENYIIITILVS